MSIKKEILKTIGDLLMEKLKNLPDGLPDLMWFDKQMGQFVPSETDEAGGETPEAVIVPPLPAVLMEYEPFTWQTTGDNNQKGSGNLKFTIYCERLADSFAGSPVRDLALQYFDFVAAVHQVLQGFQIENVMSPLTRVEDEEDLAPDGVVFSVISYNTTIFDHSTSRTRNYVMVTDPGLELKYKEESSRPVPAVEIPAFLT